MGKLNLYERPYHLNEDDVRWVQETLAGMTLEEKIGQVFFAIGLTDSDEDALAMVEDLHIGGIMYRPNQAEKLKRRNDKIQAAAKIPLLIAANLEAGGSGALVEGTPFGSQLQVAATGRVENARLLGDISGAEAASVGFNLAFAPVCDIDRNWRNPITNTRTYGSDPEVVRSMCSAYLDGISKHGVAVSIKHFPGDGCDERDQHLVTSVNDLSCEEWDATYGMVYRALIEQGAQTVMAGHLMQPAYSRYFSPGLKDSEQMPASCSKELIDGLLRTKLGFQGVVLTDAANMIGLLLRHGAQAADPGDHQRRRGHDPVRQEPGGGYPVSDGRSAGRYRAPGAAGRGVYPDPGAEGLLGLHQKGDILC